MKRVLREPLFHFLLLGALLFAVFGLRNRSGSGGADDRTILISTGRIEHLAGLFARTWQRPPTDAELRSLVDDHIAEEVLYREAVAMGLDQDDTIVRRRLRQKLEFITSDLASTEPTDEELQAYLASHPGEFVQEPRSTFRQVYLDPTQHGDRLESDLAALRARLEPETGGPDLAALGDRLLLPQEFTLERHSAVAAQFGDEFAAQLGTLPLNEWSGPISSSYGVHLVIVTAKREGRSPGLDEVRARVRSRLLSAREAEAREQFLEDLLSKYQVTIQWPGQNNPEPYRGVPEAP